MNMPEFPATVGPDRVRVRPGALSGSVDVPGDKSLSHRALLIGALADGPVTVSGLAPSGDVLASAKGLTTMGAEVALARSADGSLSGSVTGPLHEPDDVVDCGNSGTSLRLLAGIAAGIDGVSVLTGDVSLRRRPVDRVVAPLEAMGVRLNARDGGRLPPLVVEGGSVRAVSYDSPVASAQVKSCVLLAGLAAEGPTTVTSPAPSRDHTERMLAHLGVSVTRTTTETSEVVTVVPGRLNAGAVEVARDPSSAAFWLVAAAIGGGRVDTPGVCVNPTRTGFVEVLRAMGVDVDESAGELRSGETVATLCVSSAGAPGGIIVDGARVVDALDELPILALAGMCSEGGIEVRDASELRVKESDRIATLVATLRALGVEIEERDDGYRVPGGQRPRGGVVDAHHDHRIAMTAAIAGTIATGPVDITGFGTVSSSYPTFLSDFAALGGDVEVLDASASPA